MEPEDKETAFVSKLLTEDGIRSEMPEWDDFDDEERAFLRGKMIGVATSRMRMGKCRLEIGKDLLELRDFLEKKGSKTFTKIIKGLNGFTRATAYTHIGNYERAISLNSMPWFTG